MNTENKEVTIKDVHLVMLEINRMATSCWYNDPERSHIVDTAAKNGWLLRTSHTQVEWTQKGIDVLEAYDNNNDDEVKKAKEVLHKHGYIVGSLFQLSDIKDRYKDTNDDAELSDEQADEVRDYLDDNHDANIGINWESIDYAIQQVVKED